MTFTPEQVRSLWRVLGAAVGFKVADKANSEIMQAGGRIVEAVTGGKQTADEFMRKYVTTIPLPWGVTVFVPFVVGEPNEEWSLFSQALVAVHEAQHAAQWHREGVAWPILYASSPAWRARYETEAKRATETFRFHVDGTIAGYEQNAAGLASYGCSVADVAVSAEELRLDAETIRAGGVSDLAASFAIRWWNGLVTPLPPPPPVGV